MYKNIFLSILISLLFCFPGLAQKSDLIFTERIADDQAEPSVIRTVQDNGLKGLSVTWSIPSASVYEKAVMNRNFKMLNIKDFTFLKDVGKPAMPAYYDLVLIPEGATASIAILPGQSRTYDNYLIYPALQPATDREGDGEPQFEIDEQFYQTDIVYPDQPVKIIEIIKVKGLDIAIIQVCPVQYNPLQRTMTVIPELSYEVNFSPAVQFFDAANFSDHFLNMLPNYVLNDESVREAGRVSPKNKNVNGQAVNYIIITHQNYLEAADSLAKWKAQLGYSVEVVSRSSWNSSLVKSDIQQRYQNWTPKPDYFVIIGDHNLVPGEIHTDPSYGDPFATDLYYACMDGGSDYVADMAFGRISVSSASEAMNVVRKIINFEKNPPSQPDFYTSALVCAQFQDDDGNDYEDRRFSLTSEDIRTYLVNQHSFTVNRVYKTGNTITPLYWNNGTYANSEPVPANLRKPTFAWDGDKIDIANEINSANGKILVLHRDHGYVGGTGWATPQFYTSDISMLSNGNRTPIVFSINCHTGEYQLAECFSERFLRYNNGGAVGVFGAAYYSYSGYNDGLAIGMIDAIWANPGLVPNFTGNGDNPVGSPTAHSPIYTMGDVMNQGLIRMIQTWGNSVYTNELFHYFGDPAMRIWTSVPAPVTATHTDTLNCKDSVFHVYSCSLPDGLATLVANGQLVASVTLSGGAGTMTFPSFNGTDAVLTISKQNYEPYVAEIPVGGTCVKANFHASYSNICVGEPVTYTSFSSGTIVGYLWDFGSDATPATATIVGPHTVYYLVPGTKTISLTVFGTEDTNTATQQIFVPQTCTYNSMANNNLTITGCNGVLYDNGGPTANYANSTNDTVVVTATGASNILLSFNYFDVEAGSGTTCDYDVLRIFNGPSTASPLLGSYCNTSGHTPPPTLTTSGNSFTLVFSADAGLNLGGFEIGWACASPNAAPNSNFIGAPLTTCTGEVSFTDLSLNNPTSWLWNFGDGNTSTQQNPVHVYTQNGIYSVTLTATNTYGPGYYLRTNYIEIFRPAAPAADSAEVCLPGSATLHATGNGDLSWYDTPVGGSLLGTGGTFNTPVVSSTTSFWVQDETVDTHYVGPVDDSFGATSPYTSTSDHYLRFDALTDILLVSVKVKAQNTKNRTIELRNGSGVLIYDTVVNISAGTSRVYLNYPVPAGTAYRLACPTDNNQLYRNTDGASFPFTVSNIVSITGNSYSATTYYYFYDWEVTGPACKSPRTEATVYVVPSVPATAYSFVQNQNTIDFTNLSTGAISYLWDFDDGNTSPAESPVHNYTANGTYYVSLNATNICGTAVYTDTIYILTTGIETTESLFVNIHPNPFSGELNIVLAEEFTGDLLTEIFDITGRRVFSKLNPMQATNHLQINTGELCAGLYLIRISDGAQQHTARVIKY